MHNIHGGPHSAYGEGWFDEFQNLAAQGMFVLFTNPRGSSGYGGDFTYSTRGRWGMEDYEDLMKCRESEARAREEDRIAELEAWRAAHSIANGCNSRTAEALGQRAEKAESDLAAERAAHLATKAKEDECEVTARVRQPLPESGDGEGLAGSSADDEVRSKRGRPVIVFCHVAQVGNIRPVMGEHCGRELFDFSEAHRLAA